MPDDKPVSSPTSGVSSTTVERDCNDQHAVSVLTAERDVKNVIQALIANYANKTDKIRTGRTRGRKIVNSESIKKISDLLKQNRLFNMDCSIPLERVQIVDGKAFVTEKNFVKIDKPSKAEISDKISSSKEAKDSEKATD